LLALGSREIARRVGPAAAEFAMQVKGLELAMHEPRGKVGVALGYATNEAGADHLVGFHDPIFVNPESVPFKGAMGFGVTESADVFTLGETKVHNWFLGERWNSAEKVLGFCFFGPVPRSFIQAQDVVDAVRAATGWDVGVADILEIGERASNLARMFNVREGLSRGDDRLPGRLFTPLEGGPLTGRSIDPDAFEAAVSRLYELKGWDPATGVPTPERLRALGLEWAAEAAGVG
jgi:aldehyde:ferredoxin oxidoreductase